MGTKRYFVLAVVCLFCVMSVSGQTLAQLIDAAIQSDPELRRVELARERLDIQYALEDLGPSFGLTIGTGTSGLSLLTQGGSDGSVSSASSASEWSWSAQPFAEVTLDGDHTIRTDVGLSGGENEDPDIDSVGISYGWDLGTLGETNADRLEDAVRLDAQLDADQAIRDRRREIAQSVTELARALLAVERAVVEATLAVDSAADALSDAEALGTVGLQSAAAEDLRVQLARAERVLESRQIERVEAIRDLAEVTGLEVSESPRFAASEPRGVPDALSGRAEYDAALRNYDLAVLRYAPDDDPVSLSVGTDYLLTPEDESSSGDTPALHTIGAEASLGFGDWEFTLGSSVRFSEDTDIVPTATTTSIGISWSLPEWERDDLESRQNTIDLEQAELVLEATESSLRDRIQSLEVERRALLERAQQIDEERLLAELRLLEAQQRFELGLVGIDLVEDREAALIEVDFDEQLFAYDIVLFGYAVEAAQGEDQ